MGDKRMVNIKKERQVVTYAELWHTSWSLLKQGQSQEEGSFHQFMGSLVFTAFSFEAYLNHIGPMVFGSWDALERLAPKEKLDIIAEKIGLPVDYGKRPWGIVKELFGFRNDIAHGKSIKIAEDRVVPLSEGGRMHAWVCEDQVGEVLYQAERRKSKKRRRGDGESFACEG